MNGSPSQVLVFFFFYFWHTICSIKTLAERNLLTTHAMRRVCLEFILMANTTLYQTQNGVDRLEQQQLTWCTRRILLRFSTKHQTTNEAGPHVRIGKFKAIFNIIEAVPRKRKEEIRHKKKIAPPFSMRIVRVVSLAVSEEEKE